MSEETETNKSLFTQAKEFWDKSATNKFFVGAVFFVLWSFLQGTGVHKDGDVVFSVPPSPIGLPISVMGNQPQERLP